MNINNIKDFKNIFFNEINKKLHKEQYSLFHSKQLFKKTTKDNIFSIYIYLLSRKGNYLAIETKAYYGNKAIEKELKNNYSGYKYQDICGGTPEFLCTYYFKQSYNNNYDTLIYKYNSSLEDIVELWLYDYEKYIKPFFADCSDIIKLNAIVNNERINTTGLNLTYKNRVLKSLVVGCKAGLANNELEQIANKYENYIKNENLCYLSDFVELKNNFLVNSM